MSKDTFDEILSLEERFYDDGYQDGLADGIKAGRIEGRTMGLEKGFEKYVRSARLYGKALVWANRMPVFSKDAKSSGQTPSESNPASATDDGGSVSRKPLPSLPNNQRLAKHIKVLHALAESGSLSTENTEEAVADFDDRLKRAQAKVKIIERMVGEVNEGGDSGVGKPVQSSGGNIEDANIRNGTL
ncbi:Uncharacterized protein BP5553_05523 [Venustampulla echinocandica]|uniref:Essential protein Yae1 N-terminal domain-containing protein n=1 Tax=Venustampulla echinocandica TaxID=2656787 RepID=A0A370TRE0_9HELO|nr:Uncharacterized protein BP5553_05523 [Venustampulla echinocandica]RDL38090.1 Uncharacterized protein BP5553_05523 [Venustampulla echinocandica]